VLDKAIARDRNERYKTAADMLADLQACAASESVQACAAARVRRSAVSRLRSRSGVDCNWTAAARNGFSLVD